jgi:hypothetical protein
LWLARCTFPSAICIKRSRTRETIGRLTTNLYTRLAHSRTDSLRTLPLSFHVWKDDGVGGPSGCKTDIENTRTREYTPHTFSRRLAPPTSSIDRSIEPTTTFLATTVPPPQRPRQCLRAVSASLFLCSTGSRADCNKTIIHHQANNKKNREEKKACHACAIIT